MWSCGNFEDKNVTLEEDVVSALKAMAKSAQQTVTQVAQSVKSAFSQHWKRFMEKAR